jgi:hypothetical protein
MMSTLPDPPTLTTATTAINSASPSLSSISTSSDDAPQLSFEYIWDDEGNFVRLSKRPLEEEERAQIDASINVEDATGTPKNNTDTHLSDVLGNERTYDNPQSIASVLSHSVSSVPQQTSNMASSRPFNRAVSGPAVTPGGHRPSLLVAGDRPLVRARRVPIEEKRKQDAELERRDREEEEREREGKKLRLREKEKENWATGADAYVRGESLAFFSSNTRVSSILTRPSSYNDIPTPPDHRASASLSSSLTRTYSDPYPLATPELPQHEYHSQPQPPAQSLSQEPAPYRSRRPLSKQQRVLGVSRPTGKDVRTSGGSVDVRTSAGSTEASSMCSPVCRAFPF